ncbi:hypothetical protein TNCV_5042661 [Trichonephila clavipes]|nr:hypothetical protein TNCV_5042661 [Trichonephila clavipes]
MVFTAALIVTSHCGETRGLSAKNLVILNYGQFIDQDNISPTQTFTPSQRVSEFNVALFSYSRAFGDGPRSFELWSSDEDDT